MQKKMKETPAKFRVRIHSEMAGTVYAPLPDGFGMTVGSEFSAPFDANFASGTLSKALAVGGGIGNKTAGISTTKFYSNPEPSEISIELQFEAYHSAREDVLVPVIRLMAMSLGRTIDFEGAKQIIESLANKIGSLTGLDSLIESEITTTEATERNSDRILGFLNFVQGPPTVSIRFGNTLKLDRAYISSVAPQFSNILDSEGIPMSATCSITAILERDPVLDEDSFDSFWPTGSVGRNS